MSWKRWLFEVSAATAALLIAAGVLRLLRFI